MPIDTIENIVITVLTPQYAGDVRIPDMIALAEMETSSCYGEKYNYAVALRVSHMLALDDLRGGSGDGTDSGSGEAGSISSEKEGDLARAYGNSGSGSSSGSDLTQTRWGLKLIDLQKGHFMLPRTSAVSSECR